MFSPEMQDVIREAIGVVAAMIAIGSSIPYMLDMVRGKTKPERSAWLIWASINVIIAITYQEDPAAHASRWVPYAYAIITIGMLPFLPKYGKKGWTRLDVTFLAISLSSLVLWVVSGKAVFPLTLNIALDCLASVLVIIKAWQEPDTENRWGWTIATVAAAVQMFAVSEWSWTVAGHPTYAIVMYVITTVVIWHRRAAMARRQTQSTALS